MGYASIEVREQPVHPGGLIYYSILWKSSTEYAKI